MTEGIHWVQVLSEARLKRERRCVVRLNQQDILLMFEQEEIVACELYCPHQGFSLEHGMVDREENTLICPLHAWSFDLKTGRCQQNQAHLKMYPVKRDNGKIFLTEGLPLKELE